MKNARSKSAPKKSLGALAVTDQDYLPVLLQVLDSARKRIDIIAYSFAIGSAAGRLNLKGAPYAIAQKLIALKEKRGESLKIRLYLEGSRETNERNRVTGELLREAGVEIKYGATHAKGFCIDDRFVILGSTNLTHQSIMKNFEANLLLEGPVFVKPFTKYFKFLWAGGRHGGLKLRGPLFADGEFKNVITDMIQRAQKTIVFSIYFFNHREIEKCLIEAHLRGVKVKGFVHDHASFALPYIWANRSTIKRLAAAGIKDLTKGPVNTFSHAKYIISDQHEVALGTGNWLVEDVEEHPQLYVYLDDKIAARELLRHFKNESLHGRRVNE